jgi:hypothetical protein
MEPCKCGHMPWAHSTVTYPTHRQPCTVCVMCGQTKRDCCLTPKRCACTDFQRPEPEPVDRYTQDTEAGAIGG